MNEVMIEEWNYAVGEDDTVYHLGDFSFGTMEENKELVKQLNGKIHLCLGSHDQGVKKAYSLFEQVKESYLVNFKVDGKDQHIFMSHYLHKVWPLSHYGSWHFTGHSHSRMDKYIEQEGKILDVGVDGHKFKPWSLEEVMDVMVTRPNNFNFVGKV